MITECLCVCEAEREWEVFIFYVCVLVSEIKGFGRPEGRKWHLTWVKGISSINTHAKGSRHTRIINTNTSMHTARHCAAAHTLNISLSGLFVVAAWSQLCKSNFKALKGGCCLRNSFQRRGRLVRLFSHELWATLRESGWVFFLFI